MNAEQKADKDAKAILETKSLDGELSPKESEPVVVDSIDDDALLLSDIGFGDDENTDAPKRSDDLRIRDEEEDEEEEGMLWIILRVVWSIVKTLFFVGLFFGALWLIWKPSFGDIKIVPNNKNPLITEMNTEESKIEKPEVKPKIEAPKQSIVTTPKNVIPGNLYFPPDIRDSLIPLKRDDATVAMKWHLWMEEARMAQQDEDFGRGLRLIKQMRGFYDVPIAEILNTNDGGSRVQNVDQTRAYIGSMVNESYAVRQSLVGQIQALRQKMLVEQEAVVHTAAELELALQELRGDATKAVLAQNVNAQQQVIEYRAKIQARERIIREIEAYDKALRQLYDNMTANREVLIRDLEVVEFQGDPFRRVITPDEYQQRGQE